MEIGHNSGVDTSNDDSSTSNKLDCHDSGEDEMTLMKHENHEIQTQKLITWSQNETLRLVSTTGAARTLDYAGSDVNWDRNRDDQQHSMDQDQLLRMKMSVSESFVAHSEAVTSLEVSGVDERTIATGSSDSTIRVWRVQPGGRPICLRTYNGHRRSIRSLHLLSTGFTELHTLRRPDSGASGAESTSVVSCDGGLHVWDVASGRTLVQLESRESPFRTCAPMHHGCQIAAATETGTLCIIDTRLPGGGWQSNNSGWRANGANSRDVGLGFDLLHGARPASVVAEFALGFTNEKTACDSIAVAPGGGLWIAAGSISGEVAVVDSRMGILRRCWSTHAPSKGKLKDHLQGRAKPTTSSEPRPMSQNPHTTIDCNEDRKSRGPMGASYASVGPAVSTLLAVGAEQLISVSSDASAMLWDLTRDGNSLWPTPSMNITPQHSALFSRRAPRALFAVRGLSPMPLVRGAGVCLQRFQRSSRGWRLFSASQNRLAVAEISVPDFDELSNESSATLLASAIPALGTPIQKLSQISIGTMSERIEGNGQSALKPITARVYALKSRKQLQVNAMRMLRLRRGLLFGTEAGEVQFWS
jgi:WD40 repeat protein